MSNPTTEKNAGTASATKKLEELYELLEGMDTAMMTTRRPDGYLVSRPMATQKHERDADLWFVTNVDSDKLDELRDDPHINLAYYDNDSREWVSVSGRATISDNRAKIRELYAADWRAWFGDEGGARDGGPDDPRIRLIFVDALTVVYLKSDRPRPLVLFDVAKGIITGEPPRMGELRRVSEAELAGASENS
jgi:general stress protein 26